MNQQKRFKTRTVSIGNIDVGGSNPIRIQSMTTSSTRDVEATVNQIIRLSDHGCEMARVTVQGMKEAEACGLIKNSLIQKGYDIPLIADIHFYPPAAMRVVDFVDKVRVNPGNFVDRRASFKTIEYDDALYAEEIEKIEEKFAPLVEKCIKLGRAMRIGTNHGSLSDRIMNRYGDTPFGMVESALEFARVCRKMDYHNFLFSMKASNPLVMIEAYRLLVDEMTKIGWDYPLHLGVTEAGEGEDGRIKSAVGIGSLLLEGIGDTIRVSLTEDPWKEIDPCKRLVSFTRDASKHKGALSSRKVSVNAPLHRDGSVILTVTKIQASQENFFEEIGCEMQLGRPQRTDQTVDALIFEEEVSEDLIRKLLQLNIGVLTCQPNFPSTIFVSGPERVPEQPYALLVEREEDMKGHHPEMILLRNKNLRLDVNVPVILYFDYESDFDDLVIQASSRCGSFLADNLAEGIALRTKHDLQKIRNFSFNLLQACRMRSSKTEFISCPGCGRTLFDLQSVSQRIRKNTGHLPGVKIAIMGCIVNGPGEMADADFGYVGSRPGKIDLYVGKECVERGIDHDDADDRLIQLIKDHDLWIEPIPQISSLKN